MIFTNDDLKQLKEEIEADVDMHAALATVVPATSMAIDDDDEGNSFHFILPFLATR